MLDFNLIEIELRKLLPPDYEKVIVFAHVKENYVGGFNAFNLKGESQTRSFDNVERLYKICLDLWNTRNSNEDWCGILYILESREGRYELYTSKMFNSEDLFHIELEKELCAKHFPNMSYVSDDEDW